MSDGPLALHITFGTYGTRLHGDPRGTVDRHRNRPGEPIIGRDEDWQRLEREALRFEPVYLTPEQRRCAQRATPGICERGKWEFCNTTAQPDHVHVLPRASVSDPKQAKAIRKWFKRWLGETLSEHWPRPAGASWWSEGGSVKWVWTQAYFERVYRYIEDHPPP